MKISLRFTRIVGILICLLLLVSVVVAGLASSQPNALAANEDTASQLRALATNEDTAWVKKTEALVFLNQPRLLLMLLKGGHGTLRLPRTTLHTHWC